MTEDAETKTVGQKIRETRLANNSYVTGAAKATVTKTNNGTFQVAADKAALLVGHVELPKKMRKNHWHHVLQMGIYQWQLQTMLLPKTGN